MFSLVGLGAKACAATSALSLPFFLLPVLFRHSLSVFWHRSLFCLRECFAQHNVSTQRRATIMQNISRRNVVKWMGASASVALLAACQPAVAPAAGGAAESASAEGGRTAV